MQRLGSIVPWKTLSHLPNINSLSRLMTGLSILMPEEFDGQHPTLATSYATLHERQQRDLTWNYSCCLITSSPTVQLANPKELWLPMTGM